MWSVIFGLTAFLLVVSRRLVEVRSIVLSQEIGIKIANLEDN